MSLLDKLTKIIGIDTIDLSGLRDFRPRIFSDNKIENKFTIDKSKKTYNINLYAYKKDEIAEILRTVKESVEENDDLLIEDRADALLEDVALIEGVEENIELVKFFRTKIDSRDLEILRAALYVKHVHDKGEQVGELKQDIVIKYGERGRNIVNLGTAGYFSTLVKPLFEELIYEPNFNPSLYQKVFDTIITQSPTAIFVSGPMHQDQLLKEVKKRMQANKMYGLNYLNIHGIGEQNIDKIAFVLGEIKDDLTRPPDIESGSGKRFIIVTIYF